MTTQGDASGMSAQPVQSKGSFLALVSVIFGILSFCLWFIGAIPAIIFGIVALAKISGSQGRLRGKGLAITGLVTGGLGLVLGWIIPLAVAAFFGVSILGTAVASHAQQIKQGQELVAAVAQINNAIVEWAQENGIQEGAPVDCKAVSEHLPAGELRDKVAALGSGGGSFSFILSVPTIVIGNVGKNQVGITSEAKKALPTVFDWGMD